MDGISRLDFLEGLQRTGIVPGLSRIKPLLERLGNPHKQFVSVLITGTNGKGSTAAFLEAVLRAAGYKTGLFTSPHLVCVRERVRIAGRSLSANNFSLYGLEVKAAIDPSDPVTYFEALTAIGFLAFAREAVDVAVVEVGMGGRYDSTNVLEPVVSVFTNVSLDHQRFLGNTVEEIALEKVQIARPARTMVTGVADAIFKSVVGPALEEIGAIPKRLGVDFWVDSRDGLVDYYGQRMTVKGLKISLAGTFQIENTAMALAAAEALVEVGFKISEEAVREGLAKTWWPGRFQKVSSRPTVILDGAHNPGAAERLRESIVQYGLSRPLVLVHAGKSDKDHRGVLSRLLPVCDICIETSVEGLENPEKVASIAMDLGVCPVMVEPDLIKAMALAKGYAGEKGTVLVTGSLYLVGTMLAQADRLLAR